MTPELLRRMAEDADTLYLTIPEPAKHNGHRLRLFAGKGPYAVIINGKGGRLTVRADSAEVLRYLDREGI